MLEKKWIISSPPTTSLVNHLSRSLNISNPLSSILINRGIDTYDKAKKYFRPSLSDLHDPFKMKGMDIAVERLSAAVDAGQKILIYGDYDVDGTTAVSVVYDFLSKRTGCLYYIPDRYGEGYGVSEKGIQHAVDNDVDLIISLDCGIRANDQIQNARDHGIDFIVCDHHTPGEVLPPANAILDPKQSDCEYPFTELSGCGVGFKLLHGYCVSRNIDPDTLLEYLDLLVVSIAADIVPIIDENRVFAYLGLEKLNKDPRPGLAALIKISKCYGSLDISSIVFAIGPRINAAGRMAHGSDAVQLLLSDSIETAKELASGIDEKNDERRDHDARITGEALDMILAKEEGSYSNVVYKEDWHKGVIGIVASRCVEKYYRPTIVIAGDDEVVTGSARSIPGFNIHDAISACGDLLVQYGGHKYAAGLTIEKDNIPEFQRQFEYYVSSTINDELLTPTINIDLELELDKIYRKFYGIISQMAPFGPGNLQPVFGSTNIPLHSKPEIIKDAHLKLRLVDEISGKVFEAIGFGMATFAEQLDKDSRVDVAYHLTENRFQGSDLQLVLKDIKLNGTTG